LLTGAPGGLNNPPQDGILSHCGSGVAMRM
jgi:hypothetical protein